MIFGIGTDIVRIGRMHKDLDQFGDRFAARVLSDIEFNDFSRLENTTLKARFLAKRFAAKEAAAKALGTGFRDGLSLKHIEVLHDPQGKPLLAWHGAGREIAARLGIGSGFLSIADEEDYAIAYVVLMNGSQGG